MHLPIKILRKTLDIIYPRRCLNCKKIIPYEYFCEDCEDLVSQITVKLCSKCGLPRKFCSCKWNFYYFDEIISCFESLEANKNSFYFFKFGGYLLGGSFFASEMAKRIKDNPLYLNADVITSVPMHSSSYRKRGYDQVKILAKSISKILNKEYTPLLLQPQKSQKQHETTDISERFANVSGKYIVKKNANIKNKTVLLVDDIKTTGATLSQCARELKLAGAKSVLAISAITIYPKPKEDKKSNPLKYIPEEKFVEK